MLRGVVKRTPAVGETCELSCGHVYSHPPSTIACSTKRHHCAACVVGEEIVHALRRATGRPMLRVVE